MAQPTRDFPAAPPRRRGALLLAAVLGIFALPLLYLLVAWLTAPHPIRYEISAGVLRIVTAAGLTGNSKDISLGRLDGIDSAWLKGGSLEYGSVKGGYCVGFFHYGSLGSVWQATDCTEQGVVLRAGGELHPVVITPSDVNGFIEAATAGRDAAFRTRETPHGVSWSIFAILAVLIWPLAAFLFGALFLAPRRLRYRVVADRLETRSVMLRNSFPLAGARVRLHQPLVGEKQAGLRLAGWIAGTFVYDEQPTTVIATGQDDGVLVEGDQRLFITPSDPQGFLSAAESAGAVVRKP